MMGRHYAVTAHSLTALMVVVDNSALLMSVLIYDAPICIALSLIICKIAFITDVL